ncbi:MAG: hypothetical protein GEU90_19915 [Gemmatimonas sp.]|nr:hypothetical protein [Gemmatimonas sp.]
MYDTDLAEIRTLDEHDIHSILARNSVGRLAFVRDKQIDVLPIQYVYCDGSIYGRTSAGGKLLALQSYGSEVAFEVDEIQSTMNWRSVLTHGTFQVIAREDGEEAWLQALGLVRRLHRRALRQDDPRPERNELFRVLIRDVTGRALG